MHDPNFSHRVVIVGGGFGGLHAARLLRRAPAKITLLDRHNYHLFQPLLYQVATGALSPANIAAPLRALLSKQRNTRVLLGEVSDIRADLHTLTLTDGDSIAYDTLVLATGSAFNYFGHEHWSKIAPGLKTIEDATTVRARLLTAYEKAEREDDPEKRKALLTFVIVGGGPTGVEMAGAFAEVARKTLKHDFREIDPAGSRIILVEAQEHVLGAYPRELSAKAKRSLIDLGVEVRTATLVTDIGPDRVVLEHEHRSEPIDCKTVIWTAGVKASPVGQMLANSAGARLDPIGRVIVQPNLTLAGHPEIFVIGDLARFDHQTGQPLPGVAPVAIQQGKYVANVILKRFGGRRAPGAFRYRDRGNMATIGRSAAVADLGWIRLWGLPAWLVWLFVHLLYLVEFENRILVLIQWAWNYFTRNRSARLITEQPQRE